MTGGAPMLEPMVSDVQSNAHRPLSADDDPAVNPRIAGLGGAVLASIGAVLALWSGLTGGGDLPVMSWLIIIASAVCAIGLAAWSRLWTPRAFHVAAGLATACVTSAVVTSIPGQLAAPVFYVPVVLYVAYFLTTSATIAFAVLTSGAFSVTALAEQAGAATARAAFLTLVIAATAGAVRVLRDRVFELIGALDRTARTDALTGVLNRLGLDERLDEEIERAGRTGVECAVLMGDLDHFKALNDRYGHQAGDAALRQVAATVSARIRRLDTVGRFGGDEFVVVLPGTSRTAARKVARELAQAVRGGSLGRDLGVGVSFGLAMCPADGASADEVLTAADRELLEAKGARRPELTLAD